MPEHMGTTFEAKEKAGNQEIGVFKKPADEERKREALENAENELNEYERMHDEDNIFDPDLAMKRVRALPEPERKARVAQLKERLVAQREELAHMEAALVTVAHKRPDASAEELMGFWEYADKRKLMPIHETLARRLVEQYVAAHRALKAISDSCGGDAVCLFQTITGSPPKGLVRVMEDPLSLYFQCANIEDYALIQKERGATLSEGDIASARRSGGVQRPLTVLGIEISVTAENVADQPGSAPFQEALAIRKKSMTIRTHEGQHALTRFFETRTAKLKDQMISDYREDQAVNQMLRQVRHIESHEKKLILLRRYFRWLRHRHEVRAKSEILSYFRDGREDRIYGSLTETKKSGGLYDYFNAKKDDHTMSVKEIAIQELSKILFAAGKEPTDAVHGKLIRAAADYEFGQGYQRLLRRAIKAFAQVRGYFLALPNQSLALDRLTLVTISLFMHEPLQRWHKVAQRIIRHDKSGVL